MAKIYDVNGKIISVTRKPSKTELGGTGRTSSI